MVDEIDLEEMSTLFQIASYPVVRRARRGIAARMVVHDSHGERAVDKCLAKNFPWMSDTFIQRAEADFLHTDEAELCVQEEDSQRFLSHGHKLMAEEIKNTLRRV